MNYFSTSFRDGNSRQNTASRRPPIFQFLSIFTHSGRTQTARSFADSSTKDWKTKKQCPVPVRKFNKFRNNKRQNGKCIRKTLSRHGLSSSSASPALQSTWHSSDDYWHHAALSLSRCTQQHQYVVAVVVRRLRRAESQHIKIPPSNINAAAADTAYYSGKAHHHQFSTCSTPHVCYLWCCPSPYDALSSSMRSDVSDQYGISAPVESLRATLYPPLQHFHPHGKGGTRSLRRRILIHTDSRYQAVSS